MAEMLDQDDEVPAKVILGHLRRHCYAGGITILKEHVATVRPAFLAARSYQRTSYLPGELAHGDWWEPPKTQVPVRNGARREPYDWVKRSPTRPPTPRCSASGRRWPTSCRRCWGACSAWAGSPRRRGGLRASPRRLYSPEAESARPLRKVAARCGPAHIRQVGAGGLA